MICDRLETVVIPFPFAEIPVLKRRPVVVLSGRSFNQANAATLVAMVTSTTTTAWPSDLRIGNLESAGLRVPSILRWRLTTIPNGLIIRKLGRLTGLDRLACERGVADMILD